MPYRWRWPLGLIPASLAVALCLLPTPATSHPLLVAAIAVMGTPTPLPDPLPIRRVLLPAERVEAALAATGRDQFVRMPRTEFEARVQGAARRQAADRLPPQIVEATYQAQWTPGRLTGKGQWRVRNPGGLPGAVTLEPLTPAIDNPAWADGTAAAIFRGTLYNRVTPTTYLWNASESGGDLNFAWSLRGLDEADEERFDLAFPPSPIAVLELSLPADRTPMLPAGQGDIQGPFSTPGGQNRTWKVVAWASNRLDLAIRKATASGNALPATLSRSARWLLTSTARTGTIELTIDAPRGHPPERKFQLDAELTVQDVTGIGVESWKVQGSELTVRTRDLPGPAKWTVAVSATGTAPQAGWTCPSLHLDDGLPGADTLEIQCGPEVKVEHWLPGDFRASATSANHGTKLAFTATLLPATGDDRPQRKMPTLRYRSAEYEFNTRETLDWRIEPGRNSITCTIEMTVVRGPLANVSLQFLPGYVPTNITAIPDDPGLTWAAAPGVPNTWIVEPTRAVAGGSNFGLRVEARGTSFPQPGHPGDLSPGQTVFAFPKVRPLGAADRNLKFSASASDDVDARFQTSIPGAEFQEDAFHAEYGQRDAEGDAVVSVIPPSLTLSHSALLKSESDRHVSVVSTFRGKLEHSPAAGLMVAVPGDAEPIFAWNGVAAKARLASLPNQGDRLLVPFSLPPGGLFPAETLTQDSPSTLWFVPFPRPNSGEFLLTATYSVGILSDSQPVGVPLAQVRGGHLVETRASLDAPLAQQFRTPALMSKGVLLTPRGGTAGDAEPVKSGAWVLADVRCANQVGDAGRVDCTLSGRVVEAGGPYLEIQRTDGEMVLESVKVGSHEVSLPVGRRADLIRLPITSAGETFELRYSVRQYRVPAPVFRFHENWLKLPGVEGFETDWQSDGESLFWPALGPGFRSGSEVAPWAIRASALRVTGYACAALWLAFGWYCWQRPRRVSCELIAFALALLLGWATRIESQGWALVFRPILLASVIVFAGNLLRAGVVRWPAATATLWMIATLQAQAPEPAVVYLVPGGDGTADTIYAPKALIAKLEAIAKSPLPPAVITRAEYSVQHSDDLAVVDAVFDLTSTGSKEPTFDLPFSGIRMERALIDGHPAFLDGSKGDRFAMPFPTPGRHTLELRFAVPIASAGSDREVRFGTPDVPCCRVGMTAGKRARQLDVPTRRGGQSIVSRDPVTQLNADHGGGKAIQLRWRDDNASDGAKPALSVREAAVWDLNESDSTCTSVFLYRIQGGTLSQLRFEYPENLVPVRVDVRTQDQRPVPLGVKGWNLGKPSGGWCPVDVKLQSPADGRIALVVKLRPKRPLTTRPTLRNPRSADVPDGERESYFGVRLGGLNLDGLVAGTSVEVPADALNKNFAAISELNLDRPPLRVYRRTGAANPDWKPILAAPTGVKAEGLEIIYTLGRRAEAVGKCRANIREGAVVEFEIPAGFRLFDIDGPQLGGWWRSGNRVAVWFNAGLMPGSVDIVFHGSLAADLAGQSEGGFDLPLPRWPVAWGGSNPLKVEVRDSIGFRAKPVGTAGVRMVEEFPPAPDRWNFVALPGANVSPNVKFSVIRSENQLQRNTGTGAAPHTPPGSGTKPPAGGGPTRETASAAPESQYPRLIPWIGAGAWLLGLLVVARWPARRWPERVALLGLLGAAALGFFSISGMVMLAVATVGVAGRARKLLT